MDEFIKILFISLILVSLLFGVLFIASKIMQGQRKKLVRSKSLSPRAHLHEYASRCGFSKNLLPYAYYPSYGRSGKLSGYVPCDEIAICSDGVLVMTVFDRAGTVDNSAPDVWVIEYDGGYKEVRSPLIAAERSKRAVKSILDKHGLYDVDVYSVVVLTNKSTVLRVDIDDALPAADLAEALDALGERMLIGVSGQFEIRKLLKDLSMTPDEIRKKM